MRLFFWIMAVVVGLTSIDDVAAAPRVVVQKSTVKFGSLSLTAGLVPGRHYRVDVSSSGHRAFKGQGFEYYTYVSNHQLVTRSKPIGVAGKTPQSFAVTVPTTSHITQWILGLNVYLLKGTNLTVRVLDLGKK